MDTFVTDAPPPAGQLPLASAPPAPGRLGTFALVRTMVRNPMEAWPEAVYREGLVRRPEPSGGETVFVTDPELLREILVERPDEFIRTVEMDRGGLRGTLRDSLLTTGGTRWRWQRRTAAPIFRHERLLGFVPAMHAAAALTRDRWLRDHRDAEIELSREMMRTMFEIIIATMLPGAGTALSPERVERAIEDLLKAVTWHNAYGLLGLPFWAPYPGQGRERAARVMLRAMVREALADRRAHERSAETADLLAYLAAARDPETGQAMSDEQVVDNLLAFVLAGHETTALALTWTFYLLARHPEWERALLEEIASVTGGGAVEAGHLDQLVLTRQVVQESLRLYPPAALTGRITRHDIVLGGQAIPGGTVLMIPIYAIHRHQALWPDPDRFDPARFSAEGARGRHRYAYLPFAAGQHTCIGMGFALMEASVVLATLLPAVSLTLRPGHDPGLKLRITLRTARGMPMRVAARGAE